MNCFVPIQGMAKKQNHSIRQQTPLQQLAKTILLLLRQVPHATVEANIFDGVASVTKRIKDVSCSVCRSRFVVPTKAKRVLPGAKSYFKTRRWADILES